ncbi:hypothetical protein ES705_28346 [subsurface metagenome]
MAQQEDGRKQPMQLNLTREEVTETIISDLIQAGVLLRGEAERYRKILATYDNVTMLKVLLCAHELREAGGGEIITL